LGRAGHGTGKWDQIIETCKALINASEVRHRDEEGQHTWNKKVFGNLIEYAKRQGNPSHELVEIFGVRSSDGMAQRDRENWYQRAVRDVDSNVPHLRRNPDKKPEYFFSLAKGMVEDEAVRLY